MKRPRHLREGHWEDDEHERFLKAVRIYGSNWKAVELAVGTRNATQARSHAQKHFIRESKLKKEMEEMRRQAGMDLPESRMTSVAIQYGTGVIFTPKSSLT
jgi:SHAQKYF class myb-like DNA-binding protein